MSNFGNDNKPHLYTKIIYLLFIGKNYFYMNVQEKFMEYIKKLNGKGEIEIERQINIFKYRLLKIEFKKGIKNEIISYILNFKIELYISLFPFMIYFSKIR